MNIGDLEGERVQVLREFDSSRVEFQSDHPNLAAVRPGAIGVIVQHDNRGVVVAIPISRPIVHLCIPNRILTQSLAYAPQASS